MCSRGVLEIFSPLDPKLWEIFSINALKGGAPRLKFHYRYRKSGFTVSGFPVKPPRCRPLVLTALSPVSLTCEEIWRACEFFFKSSSLTAIERVFRWKKWEKWNFMTTYYPCPQFPLLNFVSPALSPFPKLCPYTCPRPHTPLKTEQTQMSRTRFLSATKF